MVSCATDPVPSARKAPPLSPVASRFVQQAQHALNQQAFTQGLALADSAIAEAPFAPEGHFVRGRLFFELGRLDEAHTAYRKVEQAQPDYPGLAHNLGNIAFQRRQYREALAFYTQEIERTTDPNPWHGLGAAHEILGEAEAAREAFEQALAADPTYAPAHASLADWYEREGNFSEALRHANHALAIDTSSVTYRYTVGALSHRTGVSAAAIPHLRRVLTAQPWNYQAAFTLGQALQHEGFGQEANTLLDRASQLRVQQSEVERLGQAAQNNPQDLQRQVAYANALRRSGRLVEARSAYHIALSLRPQNLSLQTNLATIYAQLGQHNEAEARFKRIVQADSTHAEAWLNLGLVYARKGQRAEADQAFASAFRHGHDNRAVQAFRQRFQQRR